MANRAEALRITLVTPSFNQGIFLERTIRSVLNQHYPQLEFIIVDGGSTDDSVDIIRHYGAQLAWWVSEQDYGQAHAINKGLIRATGDIVGWLNSDDTLAPGALDAISRAYRQYPMADLVYGHTCQIDSNDRIERRLCAVPTDAYELVNLNPNVFAQPGTTWRRSLHERIGYLDESMQYGMDCDFWIRAARNGVLRFVPVHLANLRSHAESKSSRIADVRVREYQLLRQRYGAVDLPARRRVGLTVRRYWRILSNPRTVAYRLGVTR